MRKEGERREIYLYVREEREKVERWVGVAEV